MPHGSPRLGDAAVIPRNPTPCLEQSRTGDVALNDHPDRFLRDWRDAQIRMLEQVATRFDLHPKTFWRVRMRLYGQTRVMTFLNDCALNRIRKGDEVHIVFCVAACKVFQKVRMA